MNKCIFCNLYSEGNFLSENDNAFMIEDRSPVTPLHTLILTKRHIESYFDASEEELLSLNHLIKVRKKYIHDNDPDVTGFNIGVNIGSDAGQTVFHLHIHLIPRRKGDTENPRGGVRGVIPPKMNY